MGIGAIVSILMSPLGKIGMIGLAIGMIFLAGDIRGKRVARAECEAAAQKAQRAADDQDLHAEREGRKQDLEITETLTQQNKVDNEKIKALEAQLAKRAGGKSDPCLYDKSTADPDDPPRRVRK
jgi:hypothetical protein